MKKILVLLSILSVFVLTAYMLPPELPSSFYGEVAGGKVGQTVTTNFFGSTKTIAWEGKVVYAMDVTQGTEGAQVIFYVDGVKAGTATYHIGTYQNADLKLTGKFVPVMPIVPIVPIVPEPPSRPVLPGLPGLRR
jgi:hypothetical protein